MVNGTRYKFNLSRQEVLKLEFDYQPSLKFSEYLNRAVANNDITNIVKAFKIIIHRSFKGPGTFEEFEKTDDYHRLFQRLMCNPRRAKTFVLKILPEEMVATF